MEHLWSIHHRMETDNPLRINKKETVNQSLLIKFKICNFMNQGHL